MYEHERVSVHTREKHLTRSLRSDHQAARGANGANHAISVLCRTRRRPCLSCQLSRFSRRRCEDNSIEELKRNAQDAVELMYHGSEQLIPGPMCDASELRTLEMDDREGISLFVNINMSNVPSRAVGFQLSLSDSLLEQVNAAAREQHLTHPAFFCVRCLVRVGFTKTTMIVFRSRRRGELTIVALYF